MRTSTAGRSTLLLAAIHFLRTDGFAPVFRTAVPHASVGCDVVVPSPSARNVGSVATDAPSPKTAIGTATEANESNESGSENAPETKLKPLKSLSLEDKIDGIVEQITPIGVFVKIGYATKTYGTALLHKSQVGNFTEVKQTWIAGKRLESLRVINVDLEEGVVGLSTFQSKKAFEERRPRPLKKRKSIGNLKLGQEVRGRVKGIKDFGAFFDIGYEKDAMVHISQITRAKVTNIEDFLSLGHMATIRITSIDRKKKTVGASMLKGEAEEEEDTKRQKRTQRSKRITVTGWVETLKPLRALTLGAEIDGQVSRITPYGAFVRIGYQTNINGGCGLLHKSHIQEKRVKDVHDVLKRGQTVKARVINIDYGKRTVGLSTRPQRTRRASLARLEIGQEMEGTVKGLTGYGAFVDIGYASDALVHISRITMSKVKDVNDYLEVGQKVQIRVIDLDLAKKTIAASMLEKEADIYLERRKKNRAMRFNIAPPSDDPDE